MGSNVYLTCAFNGEYLEAWSENEKFLYALLFSEVFTDGELG